MVARTLMVVAFSLIVVALSLAVWAAQAPDYYVDGVTGNDSNPGTAAAPWKTIQKAANIMEPGKIVSVAAGTYNERVVITRSGSPGALMTFQAGGTVVMQGFTIYANYIRVSGFEITNSNLSYADGTGIGIQGSFNEIVNNYIHDLLFGEGIWLYGGTSRDSSITSNNIVAGNRIVRARLAGILVEGRNNLIESNDISHTMQNPPGAPPRSGSDADGVRFFGSGHVIRRNYIHDITLTDPGNTGAHIDGFQTWGPCSNMIIEQNLVWQMESPSQGAVIEGLGQPVRDITIRNNVFMTSGSEYTPAVIAGDLGSVTNLIIVNNTIVALNGPTEYAFWLMGNLSGAVVRNNAIYDHGKGNNSYVRLTTGVSGLDIGSNSISISTGQPPTGGPYPGDLWMVDPKFVDFAGRDFRLRSSSALRNAGTSISSLVWNDFEGVSRPMSGNTDIGAFQR